MKNILRHVLCVFIGVIFTTAVPSYAQVIEEDDGYTRKSSGKFFGNASASFANGSSHQVSYQSVELGYDTPFSADRGRFYFSGIANNTELELELALKESARNNPDNNMEEAPEITRTEKSNDTDVRDAFLQYDLLDSVTASFGRRRVAWGQFELLSPVNLALPITPQSAEPTTNKINSMVPQDQISLTWFPTERTELQGYYFSGTQLDWLVENVLEGDNMEKIYEIQTGSEGTMAAISMDSLITERNDITDHDQQALRLLFYPNWGTLGFSYHKGRNTLNFSSDRATVERIGDGETESFNVRRHTDLFEAENFGVELAIPKGQWVWKFELLRQETSTDLEGFSENTAGSDEPFRLAQREYYNAIIANNKGELYVPVTSTFVGFGADTDRENWRLNLSIFALSEDYPDADLIQLEEAAGFDNQRGTTFVFPAINIARYIGGNKEKELGFAGGFLGSYLGVSLYYTSQIQEKFRWLVSAEAVSNQRDQLLSETGANADRYELANELSAGLRVAMIYDF